MADNQKFFQLQAQTLAGSGVSIGDTTMILTSFKDIDGNNVAMTDFGTKGWMTIEPGSADREEQISFTGITQNANGTATITGIKNVGFKAPYTETSGFLKSHPGGVKAVISNSSGFYDAMSSKKNDETIEGIYTYTNPNVPRMNTAPTYGAGTEEYFVTKRYADSLAIAGAPDASTTQKGIVEIATGAELAAGTDIGSTGAKLVASGGSFKNSSAGAGDANKVPVLNAGGKLAASFGGDASTLATLNGSTLVVQNPANATATPTASKIPIADGSGKLANGWLNTNVSTIQSLTAGEAINGATLPVAVYQSTADNEIYACDANDTAKLDFIGFAITNSTDGNPINVQISGVVGGFTGLAEGTRYYVQDDKTIGTSVGTYEILVGIAISETQLLIRHSDITDYKVGTATRDATAASGSQTIAHGLGRIPKVVRLRGSYGGANWSASSFGAFDGSTNSVSWETSNAAAAGAAGADTTNSIYMVKAVVGNRQTGIVSVDATNITIDWTKTGTPDGTIHIQWEVNG